MEFLVLSVFGPQEYTSIAVNKFEPAEQAWDQWLWSSEV